MRYNFDEPVARQATNSVKYDSRKDIFGREDLIPMWVADMDFKCPPAITEAIRKRLDHEILGYTVRRDEYFSSIRNWLKERYSWAVEKEWISFSPGVVPALNICVLAYTRPGDKIIIQPPVYFPFFSTVTDHGRELVLNQLSEEDGKWSFDLADLEQKAAEGARMLILSNPHNPVGKAWKRDELEEMAAICRKYGLIILSDEIHSDLVLPGNKHTVVATMREDIADITITCMAPSKTFNIAGLSTSSVIISNNELKEQFDNMINSLHIGGGNIFGTEASVAAYTHGGRWLDELLLYINNNIDYVVDRLGGHGMIKPLRPEATYMIWLDCRNMGMEPDELHSFFIEKASVGMSPGAIFGPGGEGYMRMNIACPLETVTKAVDNIEKSLTLL